MRRPYPSAKLESKVANLKLLELMQRASEPIEASPELADQVARKLVPVPAPLPDEVGLLPKLSAETQAIAERHRR